MIYETTYIPEGAFPVILAFPEESRQIRATSVPERGAVIQWIVRGGIREFVVSRVTHRGEPGGLLTPVLYLTPHAESLDG